MKQPDVIYLSKKKAVVKKNYFFDCYGTKVVVPKNYDDYDGCTGGLFAALIGIHRWGIQNAASLPHDYVYVNKGHVLTADSQPIFIPRRKMDKWAYPVLRRCGYNKAQCVVAYVVIRVVGYFYWREL